MLGSILGILVNLATSLLANKSVISADTSSMISGLWAQATKLIQTVRSGASVSQDGLAALGLAQGTINAIRGISGVPQGVLDEVAAVEKDVAAALAAYIKAGDGFDPSVYAPIALV
jgi:hypothetical protein